MKVVIALAIVVLSVTRAGAVGPCPTTIETKQVATASLEGWTVIALPLKHVLNTVVVFDGPPAEQVSLKYDEMLERGGTEVLVWGLTPGVQYWIQCGYFGTSVALAKPLALTVKRCEVSYSGNVVAAVTCE